MEMVIEECSPFSPFRSFHKQFCVVAKQKKIEFTIECTFEEGNESWPTQYCIRIDPIRLGQVARNLLTNALKFTPEQGSIRMVVSKVTKNVAGLPPQLFLRLEVIDSGAGISKENQKKLFGQYVQFNANALQKGGGSGLGLWICKGP